MLVLITIIIGASSLTQVFARQGGIPADPTGLLAAAGVALAPAVIVIALLIVAAANTLTVLANDAVAGRRPKLRDALTRGVLRVPFVTATTALVALTVIALLIATPLLVVLGVLGLVGAAIIRVSRASVRWPAVRTLLALAIPFAAALTVAARWILAPTIATVENVSPLEAVRRSTASAAGRTVRVGLIGVGSVALGILLQQGVAWGADRLLPAEGAVIVVGVLQLALALLPLMILVVLLREHPGPGEVRVSARAASARGVAARQTAVAVTVAAALIAVGLPLYGPASPAFAAPPAELPAQTPAQVSVAEQSPLENAELRTVEITVTPPPAPTAAVLEDAVFVVTVAASDGDGPTPTGEIELRGAGEPQDPTALVNGTATVTATFMNEFMGGEIFVAYSGDDVYDSDGTYTSHEVFELDTAVELTTTESAASLVGDAVTARARLTLTDPIHADRYPTSGVRIALSESGTELATATTDASGIAEFTLPAQLTNTVGTVSLAADIIYGQGYRTPSDPATLTHSIVLAAGAVEIVAHPATAPAATPFLLDVVAAAPGVIRVVDAAGNTRGQASTDPDGRAVVPVTAFERGNVSLRAVFIPDAGLGSTSESVTVQVTASAATLSPLGLSGTHREAGAAHISVLLTDSGAPVPVGEVVASIDGVAATVRGEVDVAGHVTLELPALTAGHYQVHLSYVGPSGITVAPFTIGYTVGGAPTTVTATVSAVAAHPPVLPLPETRIFVGDYVSVSARVTASDSATQPSGSVTVSGFTGGPISLPLTGGDAEIPVGLLAAGEHTLTVDYGGDAVHAASTTQVSVTVWGAATTVAIESPNTVSPQLGDTVLYQVRVTHAVSAPLSGEVVALIDGVEVGRAQITVQGRASIPVHFTHSGQQRLTFRYLGSDQLAPSEVSRQVTVAGLSAGFTLSYSPAPAHRSGFVTVTVASDAQLSPRPTGTVQVVGASGPVGNAVTLSDGNAQLRVAVREVGHTLSVRYLGDDRYASALLDTVFVAVPTPVSVAVQVPDATAYGDALDVPVEVTARDAADGAVDSGEVVLVDARSYPEVVVGRAPIIDGRALLSLPRGTALAGGTAQLRADFVDPGDLFASESSALTPLTVTAGVPRVSGAPVAGAVADDMWVEARVAGFGAPPSGTVTFTAQGRSETASVVAGMARIRPFTADRGEYEYTLSYSGDGNYLAAVSAPVRVTITGYPVTLTFSPSTAVTSGVPSTAQVTVAAGTLPPGSATPAITQVQGHVEVWAAGARIARELVDSNNPQTLTQVVSYVVHARDNGPDETQEVEARFVPLNPRLAAPTVTALVPVTPLRTLITARSTPTQVVAGGSVQLTAFAFAPLADGQELRPGGDLVVSEGGDELCRFAASGGSCQVTPPRTGVVDYVVTFDRSGDFAAAAGRVQVSVVERSLALNPTLSTHTPVTDSTVTVRWTVAEQSVAGVPQPSGRVSAELTGGLARCEANYADGSCDLPLNRVTRHLPTGVGLTVSFGGDNWWKPALSQLTVYPTVCYPLSVSANPPQAGAVTLSPAANCAGGTGMTHGTQVHIVAQAFDVPRGQVGWRDADLFEGSTLLGSQSAWITMDRPRAVRADFRPWAACVPVTVTTEALVSEESHSHLGPGRLSPVSAPNCAPDGGPIRPWTSDGRVFSGHMVVGTTLEVRASVTRGSYLTDPVIYGYRVNDATVSTAESTFRTVIERETTVSALKGTQCFSFDTRLVGEASLTVLAEPDCVREPGKYQAGGRISIVVEPSGLNYVRSMLNRDGADAQSADQARLDARSAKKLIDVAVVRDERIDVVIGTCHELTVVYSGVKVAPHLPDSDCPVSKSQLKKMYKEDTSFQFIPARHNLSVDGKRVFPGRVVWDDGTVGNLKYPMSAGEDFRTLVMDRDRTIQLGYYRAGECGRFSAKANPPQAGLVTLTGVPEDSVCPPFVGGDQPSASHSGEISDGTFMTLGATPTSGDPLVVWRAVRANPVGVFYFESREIEGEMAQYDAWQASFCQRISVDAGFVSANGTPMKESGLPNQDELFVATSPAPNCPGVADAWLVGTEVTVGALADPEVFTFTGWEGIFSGDELLKTVVMDGASPSLELKANYQVQCTALSVTGRNEKGNPDVAKVGTSSRTPSNCPPDPKRGGYPTFVNKSVVTVAAAIHKPVMHDGWRGMESLFEDQSLLVNTFVVDSRTGFQEVTYNFHKQTIVEGLEEFGNWMAEAARKMVGMIAIAMEQFARYVFPMGIVNMVVGIVSLLNDGLKALGINTGDFDKVVQTVNESLAFMSSGYSCVAAWAFGDGTDRSLVTTNYQGAGNAVNAATKYAAPAAVTKLANTSSKVLGSKAVGSLVNSVSGAFTKVSAVLKPIGTVAGVVGGAIGSVQSFVANIEHVGWASDGPKAWTTGWRSVGECISGKVPGKAWQ